MLMVKFLLFFQLAFKNLRRFRRRTLLVGLTVFLCAAVLVFNNSLGNGIEDQLLKNLVILQTGHLQVTPQPAETSGGAPIYWQALPPALLEFLGSHPDRLAFHPSSGNGGDDSSPGANHYPGFSDGSGTGQGIPFPGLPPPGPGGPPFFGSEGRGPLY